MNEINVIKELLFCKPIFGSSKAKDLLEITNNLMHHNNIILENCLDLCTDSSLCLASMANFRL